MVAFIKVIEGELLSNGQLSPHQLLKNLHVIQWWSLFSLLLNSFLITYGSWSVLLVPVPPELAMALEKGKYC